MKKLLILVFSFQIFTGFAQTNNEKAIESAVKYKYRVSLPGIILPQLVQDSWTDQTHTQHIELHVKRNLDNKNIIGLKLASWRLFQPMGILWWDGLLDKVDSGSEFYPGHVRETGIGFSYQRMLWKGLFATVEVLPQFKTYLDENNNKIDNGFKLYNSFHLGYHIGFGKSKRFFIEPQVHSQFWVFDTNTPEEFKVLDDKWRNYFLFEPNIYIGMKF
ncbi:hypothetical protein [Cyclobacterium amurskyense]|uniref:Uncharacterized protein n=1 Tax=Cyclobacterium amurskyense TaxID=320787 RepID=A0A0H4PKL9_9BACT|nr:hypothetical protein [Cyclobacterium amurskyense]AKP53548.1 hypothetical protein CA2015_4199 [Cyclobacterium amurskyense]|tara:strand:- start:54153 stop:54803 length:651 start_codon:yes stop_codon:yes gene_type:complete